MTQRLRERPHDVIALSQLVSDETGIPVEHVVKDFWVTELLRGLVSASTQAGVFVLFKGGTSLSKAFGLIQRFSEDVDVLVLTSGETKAKADRQLKDLVRAAEVAVGLASVAEGAGITKGVKRAARFVYPSTASDDDAVISHGVLLELGTRGGTLPAKLIEIRSLITQYRPIEMSAFEEAASFTVRVLAPERTLVEKLVLLHTQHSATPPEEEYEKHVEVIKKTARHYYDVHRLLTDETTRADVRGMAAAIARDVVTYSSLAGLPATARPAGGFALSPAFNDGAFVNLARSEYQQRVRRLVWPGAVLPDFDTCCASVVEAAALL